MAATTTATASTRHQVPDAAAAGRAGSLRRRSVVGIVTSAIDTGEVLMNAGRGKSDGLGQSTGARASVAGAV
ncbi:hypothetical protein GCM10027411_21600 [Microbacterium aureliae]